MIAIVDYDTGNLRSVQNILRHIGFDSTIAATPDELRAAGKIILPGVGTFDHGMKSLTRSGLLDVLHEKVLQDHTPVLGICLGAQLLTRGSEEGSLPGLGWIDADTRRFDATQLDSSLRIPHMGWADTEFDKTNRLFTGVQDVPRYYYVHSYHMICDTSEDELCHAWHGYRFVSGVQRNHVTGVQFHPEKSHRFGMQFLRNFASSDNLP